MNIFVPFLQKNELRVRASAFLDEHHPSLDLPIPIDRIVEFELDQDVPEAAVGMAEWQADQIAGLVLVPPTRLSEVAPAHFREVARRIKESGQAIDLTCDPVWSVIANRVAKPFEVSAQTAEICLKRDDPWGKDLSG